MFSQIKFLGETKVCRQKIIGPQKLFTAKKTRETNFGQKQMLEEKNLWKKKRFWEKTFLDNIFF